MPLLAGELICSGTEFWLKEAKTNDLYPLAYNQVQKLLPEFKYHGVLSDSARLWENIHVLVDEYYLVDTALPVPRWRFVKANDLFAYKYNDEADDICRVAVGYCTKDLARPQLKTSFVTLPYKFSTADDPIYKAEYLLIPLRHWEGVNDWGLSTRFPGIKPIILEDYYEFLDYQEKIANETPSSIAIP